MKEVFFCPANRGDPTPDFTCSEKWQGSLCSHPSTSCSNPSPCTGLRFGAAAAPGTTQGTGAPPREEESIPNLSRQPVCAVPSHKAGQQSGHRSEPEGERCACQGQGSPRPPPGPLSSGRKGSRAQRACDTLPSLTPGTARRETSSAIALHTAGW